MLADYHMHTNFSSDSDTRPEDMIEKAISLGIKTICITDHYDYDYPILPGESQPGFALDTENYLSALSELKAKYQSQIEVRIGVEMGLQEHLVDFIHQYIACYPFDFVIGSLHLVHRKDPYYKSAFEGRTDSEVYREAFEATLENVRLHDDFDVLGHMDYIVRYGEYRARDYSYLKYADIIDAILKELIRKGKGIELNTAGFKYGLPFCHPHPDILKRYKELGGELITIGSDAHKPEHIAYDFDKGCNILQTCGFRYYAEFAGRKAIFKELP